MSFKAHTVGLRTLAAGICLLSAIPTYAVESVLSYHSDITVSADRSMDVVETIRVRAEGKEIRRGIVRNFPTVYKDRYGNSVHVDFQLVRVLRDGEAEAFHQEPHTNGVRLYVGNANYFLPAGEYTYTIHYRTDRQIVFSDDHDVLYWNVTGIWPFVVEEASATVKLPDGIPQGSVTIDGYTGSYGSQEQFYESEVRSDGTVHIRATRVLQPQEGLTLVVTWPKGFVVEPTLSDRDVEMYEKDLAREEAPRRTLAPEVEADIRRMMELYTGGEEKLAEDLESAFAMSEMEIIQSLPPGPRTEEMVKFVRQTLEDIANRSYGDLLLPMISLHGDHFTPEEIKVLLNFYETPLGKKVLLATQRANLESSQRWLQWQQRIDLEISPELAKEFPELGDMRLSARRQGSETPPEEELKGTRYENLTAGFELELPAGWQISNFVRSKTGGVAGFESADGQAAGAVLREAWEETPGRYKQAVEFKLKDDYDEYKKLWDEEISLDGRAASLMVCRVAASSGEVALKFLIGVLPEEGSITRISFWGPDILVSALDADLEQTLRSYKRQKVE